MNGQKTTHRSGNWGIAPYNPNTLYMSQNYNNGLIGRLCYSTCNGAEKSRMTRSFLNIAIILLAGMCPVFGADMKVLPGHVPKVVQTLTPKARLAGTNILHLAIGVSPRDEAGLDNFVAQVSDPDSPNFRHFLTREELTKRFGPAEQDYEAVKNFALSNGLAITVTHSNRLVLDVTGPAAAIEKAFHTTLWVYQHPTEKRDFFAPKTEPSVDASLRIRDIQGLSDYWRARPRVKHGAPRKNGNGTAPDGSRDLFGDDFRNAYVPGTSLTGAGQSVGLFEFDGYFPNDIYLYASEAGGGRTNIIIEPVLLDGYDGTPSTGPDGGEGEVELDIELAMAMAPGLTKIVSFEAGEEGNQNDVLSAMQEDSSVLNLCCCWGWSGGPSGTTDAIFKSIDAVGQTFFDASGDSGAFTTGSDSINGVDNPDPNLFGAPGSNPYITQVGGTTLKLNGKGKAWSSEVVWPYSSGGISSYYPIPDWQTNVPKMVSRGGSTTFRNIPDVAACANNVYEIYDNNDTAFADDTQGTSCAAPLWAGFMALVNQQSAAHSGPSVGFVNPALYVIAANPKYAKDFHDIKSGNNKWYASPRLFSAKPNYDLCTGLGSMRGTNLINALASPLVPAFLPSERHEGRIILKWATEPSRSYQVQYTADLSSTNWINLGSPTNVSGVVGTMSDSPTNSQRFYRVLLLPDDR